MPTRVLTFRGSSGEPVRGFLHEGSDANAPLVIIAHGFKGFANWGFLPWLAEKIAATGKNTMRIDYSHNGVRERDYDRLDLFEKDTWSRHSDDLTAVIEGFNVDVIGIVGHSRGGADGILAAATDARVRAVAALAPVSKTLPDWPEVDATIAAKGHYPIENTRTKQWMPVGRDFFADARKHDVVEAAHRMSDRPLLVVHGDRDTSVDKSHGEALARAHGSAELVIVPGADHVYGATHPFKGSNPQLDVAAKAVVDFLTRELV